jgi:hypothetical protein
VNRWQRSASVVLLVAAAGAACSTAPPSASTVVSDASACGPTLNAADLDGGFLSTELQAPETGTVVDAVLATGEGGPQLTGRTILFAGTFRGALPTTLAGGSLVALEAGGPALDRPECAGSVRVALPAEIAAGAGKGEAWVEAQLGPIAVGGASIGCTALAHGPGSSAVECPSLGIRIGNDASTGTLWLRFRSAAEPEVVAALPAWVNLLTGAAGPGETAEPAAQISGTVTVDGVDHPIVAGGSEFEGVVVEPRSGGGIVYRARSTFEVEDEWRFLDVSIRGYEGPGTASSGTLVSVTFEVPTGGGFTRTSTYSATACVVEVGPEELTGSTSCALTAEEPDTGTMEIAATWTVTAVRRSVGPSVHLQWAIGGAYVSEGQATVVRAVNTGLDPSILRVAEVLVGHAGTSDLLRLDIRGFTGDGSYSGEAVEPSIQDAFGDSPNLRMNFAGASGEPIPAEERQPWSPVFGQCTATVADGGGSGTIRCPGVPGFEDTRYGGSTTLFVTWGPG